MIFLHPPAGLFLRVSRDLLAASYVANGTSYTTNSAVYTTELRNDDTNAAFYFLRQNDSTSQGTQTTQLNVKTSKGDITIPTEGDITLAGRDSKIIVVDYVFGQSETTVLYSTAECVITTLSLRWILNITQGLDMDNVRCGQALRHANC